MKEQAYLALARREPPLLLLELEQHARHESFPLINRETGRFLSTIVHAMQANRVLEIGTGMGYASVWISLALPLAGRLWAVEPDRELGEIARSYLTRAGRADAAEILNQSGMDALATMQHRQLDIIFMNVPPAEYDAYLEPAVALLKPSGLLILDGLFEPKFQDAFLKRFIAHPQLDATILPIGRGLGIGARLAQ